MLQFGLHHLSGRGLVYGVTLANTLPQTPTFSSIIPYLHYARVHVKYSKHVMHTQPVPVHLPARNSLLNAVGFVPKSGKDQ